MTGTNYAALSIEDLKDLKRWLSKLLVQGGADEDTRIEMVTKLRAINAEIAKLEAVQS